MDLLETPDNERDENWESRFLAQFSESSVKVISETPVEGPDGMPYYFVSTTGTENLVPVKNLIHWLSERGIGLVVNPEKDMPDYVFTYGMLWNFRETGRFVDAAPPVRLGQVKYDAGEVMQAGAPHPLYLPHYVRNTLNEFFDQMHVHNVRVLLLGSKNSQHWSEFDLIFSTESLGNPPKVEHRGILETIAWFLPNHYSVVMASESGLPPFFELKPAVTEPSQ